MANAHTVLSTYYSECPEGGHRAHQAQLEGVFSSFDRAVEFAEKFGSQFRGTYSNDAIVRMENHARHSRKVIFGNENGYYLLDIYTTEMNCTSV